MKNFYTCMMVMQGCLLLAQKSPTFTSEPVQAYVINVDLRDLPVATPWQPGDPIKDIPRIRYGTAPNQPEPHRIDPLLNRNPIPAGPPAAGFDTPILNFPASNYSGKPVPDTVGDVGINYYIQAVNGGNGTTYTIFNKADGSIAAGPVFLSSLGTGTCGTSGGDPIVLFDRLSMRWVISEFPPIPQPWFCVYVSQTSDPISGGWFAYSFEVTNFPDYPKYGVWPDAYYVTSNESVPRVYAFDRDAMLSGDPASFIQFSLDPLAGFPFDTATPADLTGTTAPPFSSPGIFMRHRDDEAHSPGSNDPSQDFLELYEMVVDFDTPGNSVLNGPLDIPVADFDSTLCGLFSFNCFPQPSSGVTLDPLREPVMYRLTYRNLGTHEALVGNLVTDVDGNDTGGIRWFELRRDGGPWELHQEGTFSPDDTNRWMGSISMDTSGNIAMAYNVVDATDTFPGLRYVGRLANDQAGTLPRGEYTLRDGAAPNATNRYGDYASLSVDPVDDCTFWFTGEYNVLATWSTRIASFRFDACGCERPDIPAGLAAQASGPNQIDLNWAAVPGGVSYSIYRSNGGCNAQYELLATGLGNNTYSDLGVSGGTTYAYVVRAYDPIEDCMSLNSNCAEVLATGNCLLTPGFAGLTDVANPQEEVCALDLNWAPATTDCGTDLVYNIYRSEVSGFKPSGANLIASCIKGTTWRDTDVAFGTVYYYVVRAEDQTGAGGGFCANGNEDINQVERSGSPTGPPASYLPSDIMADLSQWKTAVLGGANLEPWLPGSDGAGNPIWTCTNVAAESDRVLQLREPLEIPAGGATLVFHLNLALPDGMDGLVLEYSHDEQTWRDILGAGRHIPANWRRFETNGYNTSLNGAGHALAERKAWSGNSNGVMEVRANLGDMAGHRLFFRWRMAGNAYKGEGEVYLMSLDLRLGTDCSDCIFANSLPDWPEVTILDLLSCTMAKP